MRKPGIKYADASECASGVQKVAIDSWASDVVAKAVSFRPGGSVDAVIAVLGGRLHYGEPVDSPEGGTIFVHGKDDFDIILPRWTSPRRDRFTIAHELGHYCLHSKFGEVPLVATRAGSGRSEWEANWFAAGFLLPEKVFREKVGQHLSDAALSSFFDVSTAAVEIRKKALGIF